MRYFSKFPQVIYDFKYGNTTKTSVVKDITWNVRFRKEIFSNITLYDEYDIQDGETPEIIAEKVYGNAEYHWIVMLSNNLYDYLTDFPLAEPDLSRVISDKYPNNEYGIHHYENPQGLICTSTCPGAVSVSNDQYERVQNEKKRRIRLIDPSLINTILNNYKDIL